MARPSRLYYNNAIYHICIRGNNRQYVLQDPHDKIIFLNALEKFRQRLKFKLFCFVLMDNHVHMVIQASSFANISKIMHALALSYSVKFRRKYGYSGYVWQGRFKSNVIEGEGYILGCINYIHNNPIRAKIAASIVDYPWSSFHFYEGLNSPIKEYVEVDLFKF